MVALALSVTVLHTKYDHQLTLNINTYVHNKIDYKPILFLFTFILFCCPTESLLLNILTVT